MVGIRKLNKVQHLQRLNLQYDLKIQDIEDMSIAQLARKILQIRQQFKLKVHPQSKVYGERVEY